MQATAETWARSLGISAQATELYLQSPVIDLHIDSFIWTRLVGYDLQRRHGRGLLGARGYSQVDLPRIREAHVTGGVWSITTNPFWPSLIRSAMFKRNLRRITRILQSDPNVELVQTAAGYRRAISAGKHAAFLGIQGGNALDESPEALLDDDRIIRVTLVHLSTSSIGTTSSPLGKSRGRMGLTAFGKAYVRTLNRKRIFVDLAHINRDGFFDAVEAHDPTQPLMVSHTGVSGVHPHWRNLDDAQIKAVAATGGVVGVMYQSSFLGDGWLGGSATSVVRHLEHIIHVAGEDHAALGSDWDGMIMPPRDMPTCLELPRLVQIMLDRRWSETSIKKVLGQNFLRALEHLRGGGG